MEKENSLRQKARDQLQLFLNECNVEGHRGKKILEIGFKNGLFLDECHKTGFIPTGIEINSEYYKTVNSFDYVVSFQVLEHVQSVEHIFNECIRILKPGGIMYHICPNYHSFYEGHHKVIWLPFLNKDTGRLYLKLIRRYTPGYEYLNIVKPKNVAQMLKKYNNKVTVISLGREEFVNTFNREQIEKVDQKLLRKGMYFLKRLTFIKKFTLKLISKTNLYYPIVLIVMKN